MTKPNTSLADLTVGLTIRVSPQIKKLMDAEAKKVGLSLGAYTRLILTVYHANIELVARNATYKPLKNPFK
jgi:hypothetical protein